MIRLRRIRLTNALCTTLLVAAACDMSDTPTSPVRQFHEEEDPEKCDLPEVDCVAELDQPAAYTKSKNMHFMGFSGRPVPNGTSVFNTDLAFWGRLAYQGTYDGFRVIDISQPDNPVVVATYTGCGDGTTRGSQGDLVVWNNLLVRTWDAPAVGTVSCGGAPVTSGFEGLHVFDVSAPASPQLLASVDLPCGSHTAMIAPDPANDRLIVYSASASNTASCHGLDVVAIPLANPAGAQYLGLESSFDSGTGLSKPCHDGSVILGSVNLLACAGGDSFTVWSVAASDGGSLADPALLYTRSVTGVTIGHSTAFTWDGAVLVFGHEPGGGASARCQATSTLTDRSLFFFRARTGDQLGSFAIPRAQTAQENCSWHNYNIVPLSGRNLLVSGNYQSGISVVDFTDPAVAKEIAFADPPVLINPANPGAIVLGGDWSAYWYNGFIYESDLRRGLVVWRLADPSVSGALRLDHLNPQTQLISLGVPGS